MGEVQPGYGRSCLTFLFDDNRFDILSDSIINRPPLTDVEIGAALDAPIESPPLDEICSASDSVLIVVSDATRATASAQVVNLLVRRLIQYGVAPSNIAIIFATGIHRAVTDQEKVELLTPFIAQRVRILDHNATDPAQLIELGRTKRGTPVELNRALKDYSVVITTGAVGFHYFAGFTGGRKSICPGLASAKTIQATHMLAFDFESAERRDGVGTAQLAGNLVHEECDEIAATVAPAFSITTEVDDLGRVVGLYCGHWRKSHQRACEEYLRTHSMVIDRQRELVVVSCGGHPHDINLIQAHKALDMAAKACRQDGTIVLLAECADGFGRPDFLKWFVEPDSRALAVRLRKEYEVNGQTAWALLSKAERYNVHLVSTLPDDDVRMMRMVPARSIEDALATTDSASGYIMLRGAAVLPQLRTPD
ncbi:MAG TPA: nickel-dependent lactate racemase [Pyrinomonadaceae bacterium]|nr:nickel-dependent lactate racemase [Pyrinomonadaceae bacterium]